MKADKYVDRLRKHVEELHKCRAAAMGSVHVTETANGETIWEGEVEVFAVTEHPRAKRGYAWSQFVGENKSGERIITVLGLGSVNSAASAVRASLLSDARRLLRAKVV